MLLSLCGHCEYLIVEVANGGVGNHCMKVVKICFEFEPNVKVWIFQIGYFADIQNRTKLTSFGELELAMEESVKGNYR